MRLGVIRGMGGTKGDELDAASGAAPTQGGDGHAGSGALNRRHSVGRGLPKVILPHARAGASQTRLLSSLRTATMHDRRANAGLNLCLTARSRFC